MGRPPAKTREKGVDHRLRPLGENPLREGAALLAALGGVGPRPSVDERERAHLLGMAPGEGEGGVSAHGAPADDRLLVTQVVKERRRVVRHLVHEEGTLPRGRPPEAPVVEPDELVGAGERLHLRIPHRKAQGKRVDQEERRTVSIDRVGDAASGERAPKGPQRADHFLSQPRTSAYQRTEFWGFRTQWFSSGKTTSLDGTPCLWSAVNIERPSVRGTRKSFSPWTTRV